MIEIQNFKLLHRVGKLKFNNKFSSFNFFLYKDDKSDRKLLHEYIKSKHINYISNTVQQNKDQLIEIYHKFFSVGFYFKIQTKFSYKLRFY